MQRQLKKEWFEKYFFYGLENKDEIVKYIIVNVAKQLVDTHKELDMDNQKMNYEKDQEKMLELIVQLERFTTLHDDSKHRQYFYDSINTDSMQVHQIFHKNAREIEKKGAIYFVKYRPVSGIFFSTYKYPKKMQEEFSLCSGEELLNQFNVWVKEAFDVLCYLKELEKENRIEYYSLFLDSKYARAINRYQKGITIDDNEICEIRGVYRKFLESRSVSRIDLKLAIANNRKCEGEIGTKSASTLQMSQEMIRYIDEYYPEYDTITELKNDAIGNKYKQKLKIEASKVCDLFLNEKNIEFEI